MRVLFSVLFFGTSLLSALEVGTRYDFICSDGQDIFNAELAGEDAERYYVKLSASIARVPIEKKYVTKTINKSISLQQVSPRAFTLTAMPGVAVATGKLAGFSGFAPAAAVIGDYALFPRWHLVVRADAEQFSKDTSYLRIFLFSAGLQFFLPFEFKKIKFLTGASAGAAYVTALTNTMQQTAIVPASTVWAGVNWLFYRSWSVSLRLQGTYVYDSQTLVITPGIFLGVSYGF